MSDAAAMVALAAPLLLLYSYVGYPWLLRLLARLRPRPAAARPPAARSAVWPRVSVIVAAHDEEAVIAARLRNLLDLDYPRDRIEVLLGSDGSTDGTCGIAAGIAGGSRFPIHVFPFAARRGKAAVLNDLVAAARGAILVFTDANTWFDPGAVRALVMALRRDPDACAAVGRLDLVPARDAEPERSYWSFETSLKALESRFGCLPGANGAIYALRRRVFEPLPAGAIVDDLLVPLLARLRTGGSIVFAPDALAREDAPGRLRDEFRRRVRIGAGNAQALAWTWRLLAPSRGMAALAYLSHKVIRWAGPWLILAGTAAALATPDRLPARLLLAGGAAAATLALAAPLIVPLPMVGRAASALRYFIIINAALFLGALRFLLGRAAPTWTSAPRSSDAALSGAASRAARRLTSRW